jgi:hypothetical protein
LESEGKWIQDALAVATGFPIDKLYFRCDVAWQRDWLKRRLTIMQAILEGIESLAAVTRCAR